MKMHSYQIASTSVAAGAQGTCQRSVFHSRTIGCQIASREAYATFTISAFDTPNLAGMTLADLLAAQDASLDENPIPS
jgi:hypothetical protein